VKDTVLLDTGPLVTFLAAGSKYQTWVREQWQRLLPPLLTCELVLRSLRKITCTVRLEELHPKVVVFTLDADFRIYRRHGNQVIPVLIPEE